MQYKWLLMAALLLWPGCGTKHEIIHARLDLDTPCNDRYTDNRDTPAKKIYNDLYHFVSVGPDGDLDLVYIIRPNDPNELVGKTIKIVDNYPGTDTTVVAEDTTICTSRDSPLAIDLQEEFQSVKRDFLTQEIKKANSKGKAYESR
ncbi:MAG: hypothetical protein V1802_03515 [Candidatus Aenigmatarchaeota archaeon]